MVALRDMPVQVRVQVVAVIDFAATLCSRPPAAPEKIGPYECCLENESYLCVRILFE